MVNDAIFSDYDNDGDADLIIVGEWMPVTLYENNNSSCFYFYSGHLYASTYPF